MDTTRTGAYLATLRKAANMTQQDVADLLGVSNKTISKWESGGGFPDIAILPALAELYGVSADELLAGEPLPHVERATSQAEKSTSQVELYLSQRSTLRFRIGYAVAALCLLAAMLFRGYNAVQALLIAAAAAALWIGWGLFPKTELRGRLAMLLPLVAATIWLLSELVLAEPLTRWVLEYPYGYNLRHHMQRLLPWDIMLLLLPAAYALLRGAARQWGSDARLFSRPYFWVSFVGWAVYLAEEIIRFIIIRPKALAYLSFRASMQTKKYMDLSADLFGAWHAFEPLPWYIMGATAAALIVVAIVQFNKKLKN